MGGKSVCYIGRRCTVSRSPLFWGEGDRIVFPPEREGKAALIGDVSVINESTRIVGTKVGRAIIEIWGRGGGRKKEDATKAPPAAGNSRMGEHSSWERSNFCSSTSFTCRRLPSAFARSRNPPWSVKTEGLPVTVAERVNRISLASPLVVKLVDNFDRE